MPNDNTYNRKLTKKYYFKDTMFGLVLYVEVEHQFKDTDKDDNVTNTSKNNEFVKGTLSDAFALDLAHS